MSEIIVPNFGPPQVEQEATEKISSMILEHGLSAMFDECAFLFSNKHPSLASTVSSHSFYYEGAPVIDIRAKQAFCVGAVIAAHAYNLSGFDQVVDQNIIVLGNLDADIEGVPDVYVCSTQADIKLKNLVSIICETPELRDDGHNNMEKLVEIGAGLTRHFLKIAVAI